MIVTDLPEDILAILFYFLDAKSFLSFCRTCKDVYQYRQDPAYWRNATSSTFRLPISPLLKAGGARWYWLYKRLRTQTKLYTWGQGVKGNLGPGRSPRLPLPLRGRRGPMPIRAPLLEGPSFARTSSTWPTEVAVPSEVGVIADLQCGGWSTSILSSSGDIYTVGLIDSMDGRIIGESANQFKRLEYLTQSTSKIRQFSSGRRHILAMTDDGEILSWDRVNARGLKIFSRTGNNFGGKAQHVVAGWAHSSAYVPTAGIVYWDPIENDSQDDMLDGLHVKEKRIPGTARYTTNENILVEVRTHVVLESWIIWLASDGKLYACKLQTANEDQEHPDFPPFEVPGYVSSVRHLEDVQGQYNKFAVFTNTGEVLAGSTDYLQQCFEKARRYQSSDSPSIIAPPTEWSGLDELLQAKPADVPALQHNQVISVAFGDHHYHALHINGKITSYGDDPQSCGALGLGAWESGARFRGLRKFQEFRANSKLLPPAERRGREIWFEPEKRDWLKHMEETLMSGRLGGMRDTDGTPRHSIDFWTPMSQKQFMFSEWVEQEGRHWEEGPLNGKDLTEDLQETSIHEHDFHLDSYFALAVSAAGWHSGALVLVDDEKAGAIRQRWITTVPSNHDQNVDEHSRPTTMPGHFESGPTDPEETYVWKLEGFPKVKLPNDFEMPGETTLKPWRDGMPSLADLGLTPDS